jgi:hypothetical protein
LCLEVLNFKLGIDALEVSFFPSTETDLEKMHVVRRRAWADAPPYAVGVGRCAVGASRCATALVRVGPPRPRQSSPKLEKTWARLEEGSDEEWRRVAHPARGRRWEGARAPVNVEGRGIPRAEEVRKGQVARRRKGRGSASRWRLKSGSRCQGQPSRHRSRRGWAPTPSSVVTEVGENLGQTGGRQRRTEGGERRVQLTEGARVPVNGEGRGILRAEEVREGKVARGRKGRGSAARWRGSHGRAAARLADSKRQGKGGDAAR